MTFQEKIIVLRKKKGLTQDEFASAVGVSRQAVYKWESGKSYPEVAKLLEIKILFGISIDDLLDENYVVELPEKKKRRRLTKEVKAEIEVAAAAPAQEEEPVKEEVAIVVEEALEKEPEKAPVMAEEPVAEAEEVKPVAEVGGEPAPQKKVGFFGRLFGRK